MKNQPHWKIATIIYCVYCVIIFSIWSIVGADYNRMIGADVVASSMVLPLFVGVVFLVGIINWLGWWKTLVLEKPLNRFSWAMWVLIAVIVGFILVGVLDTNWSSLGGGHLIFLAIAGILVGFNEEALTRGILVVGFRNSVSSELKVWFLSTLLFGLLHLPNAMFGLC